MREDKAFAKKTMLSSPISAGATEARAGTNSSHRVALVRVHQKVRVSFACGRSCEFVRYGRLAQPAPVRQLPASERQSSSHSGLRPGHELAAAASIMMSVPVSDHPEARHAGHQQL